MLHNGADGGQLELAPCKPDPEAALQRMRQQREKVERDIEAFWCFDDYYPAERESTVLLGAMHIRLRSLKMAEENILKDIDKG